jgi:AbiV family abortive infection protein
METAAKKAEGGVGRVRLEDAWPLYELHAACMQNAVELKEEAELLLLGKRYARAVSLAITAREELGKAQIVADRIDGAVSRREFEDAFKRHEAKAAYVSRMVHLDLGPAEGGSRAITGGTITYDLQQGKQISKLRSESLYVAWDGAKPVTPQQNITPELSEKVVRCVKKAIEQEVVTQYMTERIGTRSRLK